MVGKDGAGSQTEKDDRRVVEDNEKEERRRLRERLGRETLQGTIKRYSYDRSTFEACLDMSRGGGEKDDGLGGVNTGSRRKESNVTRSNRLKTLGKKKFGGANKIKGPKSKSGREPGLGNSVSSQGSIRRYFSTEARPEEVGNSPGSSKNPTNTC